MQAYIQYIQLTTAVHPVKYQSSSNLGRDIRNTSVTWSESINSFLQKSDGFTAQTAS